MKTLLQLEEMAMYGACIYVLTLFKVDWWWYPIMVLGPDISMLGYLAGNKIGADIYNLFHHKGIATAVAVTGVIMKNELLLIIGIVLFGHSSQDRLFGYGLKYEKGFKFTHLGEIGKK